MNDVSVYLNRQKGGGGVRKHQNSSTETIPTPARPFLSVFAYCNQLKSGRWGRPGKEATYIILLVQ